MDKRDLISQTVRYALVTGAAITAVHVSTASAASSGTPANLGKVTVTGTRIKRSSIETAQPITRISRQQIQKSGYTNVGDLLGRLSFSGYHTTPREFSDETTVNLRNLGANRNLVLVDGKRWLQGLGGVTNLNTVPVSVIDHIEILQDGASAVYGSDAITGVVNIITVKNFNGVQAHAYYGIRNDHKTGSWDGQTKQYDFTVGSGNDRGNVVFNATYREQNGYKKNARKLLQDDTIGIPNSGIAKPPRGHFSLFGPAVSGRTFGQGTCATYDPAAPTQTLCDLTLQNAPAPPSLQNFRNFRQSDLYSNRSRQPLQVPLKDVSLYVQGHYDLFNNVTFTANAAYIRDETTRKPAPEAIQFGLLNPRTVDGKKFGIAASNPYNPFGVDLVPNPNDPCLAAGTCIGLGQLQRTAVEVGPRTFIDNRDNFHIFAGFNGYVNLFNREIDWDVGFAQNRLQFTGITNNQTNLKNTAQALGPAAQCTSPCVPLNLFGGSVAGGAGSITQAQVNYINNEQHDIRQSNLRDWTANLSSDVYNLPAGPLGLAIGYERVDNYGFYHPDAVKVAGHNEDINGSPLNGRVVRDAEYAELNIPLFADLPGVKNLSVDIANRWVQFKRSGGVTGQNQTSFVHNSSGRLNIRYQVINDFLLRASWSQGFRSPNISELFSGQTSDSTAISDPCAAPPNGSFQGGVLPANCPNGRRDFQASPTVQATSGSNANLQPESSLSRSVGFVYSPSQVPGLDLNADYFKIEINNAIGTVGTQNIVDGCFRDASFCNLVTTAADAITDIRNIDTNVGSLLTEGIDIGLHYKFPSTPVGDFDARINGTFLKTFDQTKVNRATKSGFATSHLAGVANIVSPPASNNPHPKRRFNGYLDWDYGNWSAQYRIEYIGATVSRCTVSVAGYCSLPNQTTDFQGTPGRFPLGRSHVGATVYHDVHIGYTVPSINTSFTAGVNNMFDKKPPIAGNGTISLGSYRLPSRLVYGSIRVRF